MPALHPLQEQVIGAPLDRRLFVHGPAGSGKTTAATERLRFLLDQGIPASSILMLTPQRTMQEPYLEFLNSPQRPAGGEVTSATVGGLARRMCDLFWPIAGEAADFSDPYKPPVFLTLETAQYYMAYIVRPLLEQGYFQSLTIDRNRLYSQILDNLNKAAIVGFPHTEIGGRMDSAWFGDPGQRRIYQDVQECASLFRSFCLEHNLLDFSLQLEIFAGILWPQAAVKNYLKQNYHHLIYDNVEEDAPRAHDIIADWLPDFDSALLVYDTDAGYRAFLGSDSVSGYALSSQCDELIEFTDSLVCPAEVMQLSGSLVAAIQHQEIAHTEEALPIEFLLVRYTPQMLDLIVEKILFLLQEEQVPPSEIVVLSPYLSDALRFSITHRMERAGIPCRTHRPSRSLRNEAGSQTLLTLSALAHPHWLVQPSKYDVMHALMFALGMDLVRAQILTEIVYKPADLHLSAFEEIRSETQERITYQLGERYSNLRRWLLEYRSQAPQPLDFFLRKFFGEILSQPGYGFHRNEDAIRVTSSLVESIRKFRFAMEASASDPNFDLGREYLAMLDDGVIAAQYIENWRTEDRQSVLIAPAHTFLLMNRPAHIQFWLDPGSTGWVQRLAQPLTQPYVLSRHWQDGRQWMDSDEVAAETDALARLAGGLLHRCSGRIFLPIADLGETGFEQRGALLKAFQKVLANHG